MATKQKSSPPGTIWKQTHSVTTREFWLRPDKGLTQTFLYLLASDVLLLLHGRRVRAGHRVAQRVGQAAAGGRFRLGEQVGQAALERVECGLPCFVAVHDVALATERRCVVIPDCRFVFDDRYSLSHGGLLLQRSQFATFRPCIATTRASVWLFTAFQ